MSESVHARFDIRFRRWAETKTARQKTSGVLSYTSSWVRLFGEKRERKTLNKHLKPAFGSKRVERITTMRASSGATSSSTSAA
jgi:hypothetical protein